MFYATTKTLNTIQVLNGWNIDDTYWLWLNICYIVHHLKYRYCIPLYERYVSHVNNMLLFIFFSTDTGNVRERFENNFPPDFQILTIYWYADLQPYRRQWSTRFLWLNITTEHNNIITKKKKKKTVRFSSYTVHKINVVFYTPDARAIFDHIGFSGFFSRSLIMLCYYYYYCYKGVIRLSIEFPE